MTSSASPESFLWKDAAGNQWDLMHGWEDTEQVVWTLYGWETPIQKDLPRRPIMNAPGIPSLDTYTLDVLNLGFGPLKARPEMKPEWLTEPVNVPKATGANAPVFGC